MPNKLCNHCGNLFETKPLATAVKYCSDKCKFLSVVSRFEKSNECWEWPLSINPKTGYGQMQAKNPFTEKREPVGAHRLSYLFLVGEITDKLSVLHKCDNRRCVNPDHLFLGNHKDNAIDMVNKGRNVVNFPETHWTKLKPELLKRGAEHHLSKDSSCLPRGSNHHNSKITDDIVRYIRSSKETLSVLGEKFGITSANVSAIKKNKTWKHVS